MTKIHESLYDCIYFVSRYDFYKIWLSWIPCWTFQIMCWIMCTQWVCLQWDGYCRRVLLHCHKVTALRQCHYEKIGCRYYCHLIYCIFSKKYYVVLVLPYNMTLADDSTVYRLHCTISPLFWHCNGIVKHSGRDVGKINASYSQNSVTLFAGCLFNMVKNNSVTTRKPRSVLLYISLSNTLKLKFQLQLLS